MTEIWKPVVGYESQYQVSSLGNVKSLNKGILMSPSTTPNGYSIINLSNNGRRKCFAVHRLVAQAFLDTPPGLLSTIKHVNGDKSDNSVSNLKYSSPEEEWRNIRAVKAHTSESALFSNFQVATPFIRGLKGTLEGVIKAMEERKRYRGYFWTGDKETLLP